MLESFFNLLAYGKQWKIKILHFFTSFSYIFMHKIIKMPLSEDSYPTEKSYIYLTLSPNQRQPIKTMNNFNFWFPMFIP